MDLAASHSQAQRADESRPGQDRDSLPLAALRRFVRRKPEHRCEMCSETLAPEHQHLLELASHRLLCCCDACSLLFDGETGAKYRRLPRDSRLLPDFQMTDEQWEALQIPIKLAFFVHSTPAGRVVALYPSPAGAIESLLTFDAWQELAASNPVLEKMRPDVEALLVRRTTAPYQYFLVPIDECFRLIGLIRLHWRGLSGGTEVWKEIEAFFAGLSGRVGLTRGGPHA